jgi:hypothetical protein
LSGQALQGHPSPGADFEPFASTPGTFPKPLQESGSVELNVTLDVKPLILWESEVDQEYEAVRKSPEFLAFIDAEKCPPETFEEGTQRLEWRGWAVCGSALAGASGFTKFPQRSVRHSFMYWMSRLGLAEMGGDPVGSDYQAWYWRQAEALLEQDPDESLTEPERLAQAGWKPGGSVF